MSRVRLRLGGSVSVRAISKWLPKSAEPGKTNRRAQSRMISEGINRPDLLQLTLQIA